MARSGVTTTGGRDATLRHVMGDMVLSVCMPPNPKGPAGWEWHSLMDLARMESGHTPSRDHPEYWSGNIPWIAVGDAGKHHGGVIMDTKEHTNQLGIDNSSARLLPTNTVCLSRGGTVGYVVRLGRPMATSQGFANWICGPKLDPRFLQYLLLAEEDALDRFSIGTTIKTIYYPDIKALHVCIPPLPEQQRIVTKLDAAFAALAEAQAHVERNRANARELFESYLNGVFEGKEGWKTAPLAELTEFFSDGDWIESKDQSPAGIRLVQTGNIGVGEYKDKADKARFISEATFHRLRCTDVLAGDCLISRLPEPVGRGCIVPDLGTRMITGVDCSIIRFDRTKVLSEFFVYFSQTRDYMAEVQALVTGTTRSRISRSNLGRISVRYPSTDEQRSILSELDRLKAHIDALESTYQQKLLELVGLKKGLLGAAFRGEL